MSARRTKFGFLSTALIVMVVGAATLTQSILPRFQRIEHKRFQDEVWQIVTTPRGWPFAYYENIDADCIYTDYYSFGSIPSQHAVNSPQLSWSNPQTLGLAADIVIGLTMMISTAIIAEYWRRHRQGPWQFGIRTMFIATTLVAVIITLIDRHWMHWSVLLSPLIAFGMVSMPACVALALNQLMSRSDRRLSQLRTRFETQPEIV